MDSRIDDLISAFESGEDISLLVQALSDRTREVREFARWLLSESQLEVARKSLRDYLPYSRMACLHKVQGHNKVEPNYFAISSSQKTLFSNCYSGTGKYDAYTTIHIWDLQTGELVDDIYSLHEHMGTDQNGTIILSGFLHRLEALENWRSRLTYRMLFPRSASDEVYTSGKGNFDSDIGSLAVSHDGSIVACGPYHHGWQGHIVLWDTQAERIIHHIQWQPTGGGISDILSLIMSPDKALLLSQDSRRIRLTPPPDLNKLWNVQTGDLIREFETSAHWVAHEIATTPEGKYIASGIRDNVVKVWNVTTDEILYCFPGCSPTAMTPDGKVLAYCDYANNIILWDLDTDQKIGALQGSASLIRVLCLSSDREWVVSYDADETIKIYGIPDG
jgi:WD40 repeat protein